MNTTARLLPDNHCLLAACRVRPKTDRQSISTSNKNQVSKSILLCGDLKNFCWDMGIMMIIESLLETSCGNLLSKYHLP